MLGGGVLPAAVDDFKPSEWQGAVDWVRQRQQFDGELRQVVLLLRAWLEGQVSGPR